MMQELFDKKETYIGNNVQIDEQNIINVGVDEVIITDDKTKILMTNDIHFCICVIVIGENEVGMAHLNIDKTLSRKHCELLKKLYDIKNIKEINSFIGPKTTKEALTELNGCIPYNNYVSYIN